jgi:large subunit ribosomal protein L7/L12
MSITPVRSWSPDVQELGDRIAGLTVAAAARLTIYLREVHRIEPAAAGTVTVVDERLPPPPPPPVPTEFSVWLEGFDPARKVHVIKAVRDATGLGIKEARDRVDGDGKPVGENLPPAEAEALKKKLLEAGGNAVLKPAP